MLPCATGFEPVSLPNLGTDVLPIELNHTTTPTVVGLLHSHPKVTESAVPRFGNGIQRLVVTLPHGGACCQSSVRKVTTSTPP